jgi:hypothetical protein
MNFEIAPAAQGPCPDRVQSLMLSDRDDFVILPGRV